MAPALPAGVVPGSLADRRILLVEDEYLVARYLARGLADRGAEVVGPVGRVEDAFDLIDAVQAAGNRLDGAILDVTLSDTSALPIADRLLAESVPFVFATGYDRGALPPRFDAVTLCVKPVQVHDLIAALAGAMARGP